MSQKPTDWELAGRLITGWLDDNGKHQYLEPETACRQALYSTVHNALMLCWPFQAGLDQPFRKLMVEQKTSNENFLGLVWQMTPYLRAGQGSSRVLLCCPARTPCIAAPAGSNGFPMIDD
jgi:hypothetical protein